MTFSNSKTRNIEVLISLYHLLVNADGIIDDTEIMMGELMKRHEDIDDLDFDYHLNKVSKLDATELTKDCISTLNDCDHAWKIYCVAWMSLIANSSGFMAPEEWSLIYYIYKTKLKLKMPEILELRKELPRPE